MRLVAKIRQVDGGFRYIYAQDAVHARRAHALLALDPARIDALDGVDGIRISWRQS